MGIFSRIKIAWTRDIARRAKQRNASAARAHRQQAGKNKVAASAQAIRLRASKRTAAARRAENSGDLYLTVTARCRVSRIIESGKWRYERRAGRKKSELGGSGIK